MMPLKKISSSYGGISLWVQQGERTFAGALNGHVLGKMTVFFFFKKKLLHETCFFSISHISLFQIHY